MNKFDERTRDLMGRVSYYIENKNGNSKAIIKMKVEQFIKNYYMDICRDVQELATLEGQKTYCPICGYLEDEGYCDNCGGLECQDAYESEARQE